jgi:hypothetical protein
MVKKLIAGPGVYVCNECVFLCLEILKEEKEGQAGPSPGEVAFGFDGRVATGDVSNLKKGDFVVCQVIGERKGDYKVVVLTGGPEASLGSDQNLLPGTVVIAQYVRSEDDKIVLVDYRPS